MELFFDACEKGDLNFVKSIFDNFHNKNYVLSYGLFIASKNNHENIIKFILEQNASIDKDEAIKESISNNYINLIKTLIGDNPYDLNTCLEYTCIFKKKEIIDFIIEKSKNLNIILNWTQCLRNACIS